MTTLSSGALLDLMSIPPALLQPLGFYFQRSLFVWMTLLLKNINPPQLPDEFMTVPFYPPILTSILVTLFTLSIACFGKGAYSLDNRMEK